ncbi:MAG: hypothetical protein MRJ96_13055 [Nitrospirales bacterium]|nr:hypothetical protein [Nitrospira sp.]MDR4502372.1 hypothetical protein [Nitrospirales bacterium]
MQVQLDEETWEMSDTAKLEEVIARLSDKAHERGCLVTNLKVGQRSFTDRDLVPSVLAQEAGAWGRVEATSQPLQTIVESGARSAKEFGVGLKDEAETLVRAFRHGEKRFRQLDDWFGRLADYVEWTELAKSVGTTQSSSDSIVKWLPDIIDARERSAIVELADYLEFEVVPRLPSRS